MKMVNVIKQFAVAATLALLSSGAMATTMPVTGAIDMGGRAYVYDREGGTQVTDPALATFVDFNPNNFIVVAATGDFAALVDDIGTIQDLTFDGFTGPVLNFWTVGDFAFDLTDVVRGATNDPQKFLVLNGTGVIRAAGYDDTLADWRFTADTTGNGAFTWNAASETVPEPGMLTLLSIGLIGFGLRNKLKNM